MFFPANILIRMMLLNSVKTSLKQKELNHIIPAETKNVRLINYYVISYLMGENIVTKKSEKTSLAGHALQRIRQGKYQNEEERKMLEDMANDLKYMNEKEIHQHFYVRDPEEWLKRATFSTKVLLYNISKKKLEDITLGIYKISSLSYYPSDSEKVRILNKLFPSQDFGKTFDFEAADSHPKFRADTPFNYAKIEGDFILYGKPLLTHSGILNIKKIIHEDKSLKKFSIENLVSSYALFPHPIYLEGYVNNMNDKDKRISFYGKDIGGSSWSIHCGWSANSYIYK